MASNRQAGQPSAKMTQATPAPSALCGVLKWHAGMLPVVVIPLLPCWRIWNPAPAAMWELVWDSPRAALGGIRYLKWLTAATSAWVFFRNSLSRQPGSPKAPFKVGVKRVAPPRAEPDLAKQNISKCYRQLFEMIERTTSYAVALLPYLGLI